MLSLKTFPLFKGATRLPTLAGVPLIPLISALVTLAAVALTVSLWAWALVLPGWLVMRQVTQQDDRAFRLIWLWFDTNFRTPQRSFWGAASYSKKDYRSNWRKR